MLVNEGGESPQNDDPFLSSPQFQVYNQVALSITIFFFFSHTSDSRTPPVASDTGFLAQCGLLDAVVHSLHLQTSIKEVKMITTADRELMGDPSSQFNWSLGPRLLKERGQVVSL